MKRSVTEIRLRTTIIPNFCFWEWKPAYLFLEPKGSRGYNMWSARSRFCPMFRYMLVEKGKRYANKKP